MNDKILEIYKPTEYKFKVFSDAEKEMDVRLITKSMKVICINRVCNIPHVYMLFDEGEMLFDFRTGCYKLDVKFKNFGIKDLTNYPNTLSKIDIEAIKPNNILSQYSNKKGSFLSI